VRVTAAFNRVLALPGITVSNVSLGAGVVTVTVGVASTPSVLPAVRLLDSGAPLTPGR
jgi:hypothetical protein